MKLKIEQEIHQERRIRGSFSIWDLVAILIVVAILWMWFVYTHSGERGRTIRCAANLKALGEATQSFANDHDDGLPAAVIDTKTVTISWDMALAPYIEPGTAETKSIYDKKRLLQKVGRLFHCPSDRIRRINPRSYAMSGRNMKYRWPPSPNDKTGVGISWDQITIPALLGTDLGKSAMDYPDSLPRLKRSILRDPANTLLLTELIMSNNFLGAGTQTKVYGVKAQEAPFNDDYSYFHFGKFNYLMIDGHVDLLAGSQTDGGVGKHPNIWTINPDD